MKRVGLRRRVNMIFLIMKNMFFDFVLFVAVSIDFPLISCNSSAQYESLGPKVPRHPDLPKHLKNAFVVTFIVFSCCPILIRSSSSHYENIWPEE